MRETEPTSVTFNFHQRYHCALDGSQWTLCGLRTSVAPYDDPYTWNHKDTSHPNSGSIPKCDACKASEDLPLALLGDLP